MLATAMDKWLRWLTRGVHIRLHGRGTARDGDASPSYEHIDGATLGESDFRASDAMRLDPLARHDFVETLPGFAVPTAVQARQSAGPSSHARVR